MFRFCTYLKKKELLSNEVHGDETYFQNLLDHELNPVGPEVGSAVHYH